MVRLDLTDSAVAVGLDGGRGDLTGGVVGRVLWQFGLSLFAAISVGILAREYPQLTLAS